MASPHASNLVNAGVQASQGNYVSAAASIAKSLFGGSGKTPSILQGFDVTGHIGPTGFVGKVEGFDQKGNRWIGTGETAYLQSLGLDLLTADYFHSPLSRDTVDRFFADGIPVPVMVRVEGNDNTKIPATVQAALNREIQGFMMNSAPSINASAPGTVSATAVPNESAAAQQTNSQMAGVTPQLNTGGLGLVAVVLIGLYIATRS